MCRAAVPNLSGAGDWLPGRQFFYGLVVRAGGWGRVYDSGGNESDGERQVKLRSLAAHLLLGGPIPKRPRTATGPRPRGWGPLCIYFIYIKYIKCIYFILWFFVRLFVLGADQDTDFNTQSIL